MKLRMMFLLIAAMLAGGVVYYALRVVVFFIIFDVLEMSVSTADMKGLFALLALGCLPLAGAGLAVFTIGYLGSRWTK